MQETTDQGVQQQKASFQAQLTALANEHKQALFMALAERLHQERARALRPPKWRWSFFQPVTTWLQQHLFAPAPRPIAPASEATPPDEAADSIIDAQYWVMEETCETEAPCKQKEAIV